jgi:hypothetical protein
VSSEVERRTREERREEEEKEEQNKPLTLFPFLSPPFSPKL